MKKEYKAVIASVMVLALCLCAVGGVTYSWFSDTEQADVSITAGKIDLTVGDETVYMQSYGGSEKTLTDGAQVSTDLGGSVTYTKNTANDSTKFTVVFTNAAPGDSIRIHVGDITLKNTINVKYNETYSVETLTGADPTLETPFKVDGLTSIMDAPAQTEADATARKIVDAHDIVISIPTTIGSEYMGASYKVTIMFNAYQSNAPLPSSGGTTTTATVAEGSAVDVKIAASDSAAIEGVGIKVEPGTNIPAQTLTVSDSAMQSDDAYTLSQNTTVLAGIEVTSSLGGNALKDIPTTITFTLKGDWTGTTLEVYHGTTKFADVNSTQMTYDSTNGITTIEVTTTAGFSPYFVTTSSVAAIGGKGYNTLKEAVDAAQNVDTIVLLKDITITNGIEISAKTMTLDLNGKVLGSTADGIRVDDSSNVTVMDSGNEGKITAGKDGTAGSENLPIYAVNGSTLTLNGGTFESKSCAECIFVDATSKLIINGGTYTSTVPDDKGKGWLINVGNSGSVSNISITGGTFVGYDPATGDDNLGGSFVASGYGVVKEGNKYVVKKCTVLTDKTQLSAGGCYKLGADVSIGSNVNINGVYTYLDLNGFELVSSSTNYAIWVYNGGELTIANGNISTTKGVRVGLTDNGYSYTDRLTLNDVKMKTTGDVCVGGFANSKITISSGEYAGEYAVAFATNGSKGIGNQEWRLNGATINAYFSTNNAEKEDENSKTEGENRIACGIQCHNTDIWVIKKCTFNITNGVAISVRGGNVAIDDCKYNDINGNTIRENGKLEFTDPEIRLNAGSAVAVYYSMNSYGYTGTDSASLTINGEKVTDIKEKIVKYCDIQGTNETA